MMVARVLPDLQSLAEGLEIERFWGSISEYTGVRPPARIGLMAVMQVYGEVITSPLPFTSRIEEKTTCMPKRAFSTRNQSSGSVLEALARSWRILWLLSI